MSEHLIAITFENDLPQLEIFCYCLNKHWKGNKHLTLVVNSSRTYSSNENDIEYTQKIIDQHFDLSWTVEVVNGEMSHHNGYIEQAINKILFSFNEKFNDAIVFDVKDFLIRDLSISDFKDSNGLYRAAYFITDQTHQSLYPDVVNMFDEDIPTLPPTQNLTPWIWNIDQLTKMWQYLNKRFGDYTEWPIKYEGFLPTGTEWDSYFSFTYLDNNSFAKFWDFNELIILGGIWTHQTYTGGLQEEKDFYDQQHKKIWKHSRKVSDNRCFDITSRILLHFAVPQELVTKWYNYVSEKHPYVFE
jgi:hypothetical protein